MRYRLVLYGIALLVSTVLWYALIRFGQLLWSMGPLRAGALLGLLGASWLIGVELGKVERIK